MTTMGETQTIDADALRARLAETPADLRGRIEAALRARHGNDPVRVEVRRYDVALWRASAYIGEPIGEDIHARPCDGEADALAALARTVGLDADGSDPRAEVERLRERLRALHSVTRSVLSEVDYLDALLSRQHAILTGVADALRGDPGPLASHSHHDLAERAAALVALLEVTQASLEAASSGRRVTVVDEVERLQRERDALRDAAREYLDGLEAPAPVWDADESEHDEHAARLEVARAALRALVGGAP